MVCLCTIPFLIGLIVIFKYIVKIYKFIRLYIFPPKNNLKEKYGDGYVIITGGSSGIGFSFAKQFLKQNFKLCLLSSNKEKLEKAKKELLDTYPFSIIKIIDFNLDEFYTEETIKKLEERISTELKGEEISILFNNAGVLYRGRFDSITEKNVSTMINVNIVGLTILTKIVLEKMKKRTKRSLLIGAGSVDGQLRFQNRVVYGATKSYVEAFYEGLTRDYPEKFDFTLIEIGPVKSNMLKHDMPFSNSSDEFASECIKLIGKYKFMQGSKKHFILRTLLSNPLIQYFSRKMDLKLNID